MSWLLDYCVWMMLYFSYQSLVLNIYSYLYTVIMFGVTYSFLHSAFMAMQLKNANFCKYNVVILPYIDTVNRLRQDFLLSVFVILKYVSCLV